MSENESWIEVKPSEEDELIEIIAKQSAGEFLSRRERSMLNKAEWAAKKRAVQKVAREPIRTPMGAKQRMREFKEKLLTEHNGNNVIRKVLEIAMNDEHPGQMAALKLCADRMMPVSMFEDVKKSDRPVVSINISGIGESPIVIDGGVSEVSDD